MATIPSTRRPRLADYSADHRMLILAAMATVAGTGGAFSAWALLKLIALATNLFWYGKASFAAAVIAGRGPLLVILIPVIGGLIVGLMARFGSDKIRGHGIPEAIETILFGEQQAVAEGRAAQAPVVGGLDRQRRAVRRGRPDHHDRRRDRIAVRPAVRPERGRAQDAARRRRDCAGMTGIFGTPFASIMLAVELLLFEWKPRSFVPVVTAVLVALAWRPLLVGAGPLFPFAAPTPAGIEPVAIAAGMGLVTGLLAAILSFAALPDRGRLPRAADPLDVVAGDRRRRRRDRRPVRHPGPRRRLWQHPGAAERQSGGEGGPAAARGQGHRVAGRAGLGDLGRHPRAAADPRRLRRLPDRPVSSRRSRLLGDDRHGRDHERRDARADDRRACSLPSSPITCPRCPRRSPPASAAYAISVLVMKRSILTEKIARRGRHILREYTVDALEFLQAGQLMTADPATLPGDMPLDDVVRFFADEAEHRSYPVVDRHGRLLGLVSRTDALQWTVARTSEGRLADALSDASTEYAYPETPCGEVADMMVEFGRRPGPDRRSPGPTRGRDHLAAGPAQGSLAARRVEKSGAPRPGANGRNGSIVLKNSGNGSRSRLRRKFHKIDLNKINDLEWAAQQNTRPDLEIGYDRSFSTLSVEACHKRTCSPA